MSKPVVTIAGRPNVGKSTLLNAITGDTTSIIKDTPGVARGRIYADCDWLDMNFTLIDTGGIKPDARDVILSQMREQAEITASTMDVTVFIVDVCQGLVDSDAKVVDMLRKPHKPVVLVVNKVDSVVKFGNDISRFYNLGIGDPAPVSAASYPGIGDLLDEVVKRFSDTQVEEEDDNRSRIAVAGKPNVSKSSIISRLLGENRVIVNDIVGTTRNAVDTEIIHNGTPYVFIDTAGLYRKSKIRGELERYNTIRTVTAVERVDITVTVVDTIEGVTGQDAKIAGIVHERGKSVIAAVNKWDVTEKTDKTIYEYANKIKSTSSFMPYAEYIFVSVQAEQHPPKLLRLVGAVHQNQTLRVATGVLNEIMTEAAVIQQPPSGKRERLKIYYMTQVAVKPLTFVVFVNDKELMHSSYTRYLENQIGNAFGFKGTSLEFITRERKAKK